MSKSGAREAAIDYLKPLFEAGARDPETAGILAGVYKDQFKLSTDTHFASKSLEIYQQNYIKDKSYYTGINAATMNQITGSGQKAKEIAGEVIEQIGTPADSDYWAIATLAEAHLLKKQTDEAVKFYQLAAKVGKGQFGQLNSTYGQLLLLKNYILVPNSVMKLFSPPGIAAFTGHMIDHNRQVPRFPAAISSQIGEQIKQKLVDEDILIGYSSLACGSDILFAEGLLELGGELNIFLPYAKNDFLKTSVEFAGEEWVQRFEEVLEKCNLTYITEERFFNDDVLYEFLGKVIIGSSILRSDLMYSRPVLLSVLSESDATKKVGGTKSVIDLWPFESNRININPDHLLSVPPVEIEEEINDSKSSVDQPIKRKIRYILFADIVGFSKLEEEQTPQFMHILLKKISDELDDYPRPGILNTWGDSIFAIYRNAKFTVEFAMRLKQIFKETDWAKNGLPSDLKIRIALHAGPVFVGKDPLTNKMNAYGSHINRAARMEPVAIPGLIYASNQFASALVAECPQEYEINHVGIIRLAKDYGTQEVYMIDRKKKTNY